MSVSVITPMYNEALNIESCYHNLCKQKNINFEWVVIDDGSIDNSVEIVQGIISSHKPEDFNITLVKQENSGAAAARENGIKASKYDVITILDADDELSEHALEYAYSKLSESVDVVCFQVKHVDANGDVLSEFNYKPTHWPINGQQAFSECIDGWGLTGWYMVKKSTILKAYSYTGKLRLDNTINLDELISRLGMYHAKYVDISDGVYFYYKNPSSTTNRINKNYHKTIHTALALDDFIQTQNEIDWDVKLQKHMLSTIWGVYLRYFKWKNSIDNSHEWLLLLHKISHRVHLSMLLKSQSNIKERAKLYIKILLALYLRNKF